MITSEIETTLNNEVSELVERYMIEYGQDPEACQKIADKAEQIRGIMQANIRTLNNHITHLSSEVDTSRWGKKTAAA